MKYDHLFKILIIGNSGVGKSALLECYMSGIFDPYLQSTLGIEFKFKDIPIDGKLVRMQLHDTAGQERFRSITSSYYRNAQGIILVYDVTNKQSFTEIRTWYDNVKANCSGSNIPILLVGNKVDQPNRVVTPEEGRGLAESLEMDWAETSAKDALRVNKAFEVLGKRILKEMSPTRPTEKPAKPSVKLSTPKPTPNNSCC